MLSAGTILDNRYQIDRLLGEGGAGMVYQAIDLTNQSAVAIKLLFNVENSDAEALLKQRQFFLREVELLKRVSHPNIIRVLDSGLSNEGFHYLVMEYANGCTLKSLIAIAPLTLAQTADFLTQIGSSLQAIHAQGIIHRDFKPNNVLVVKDGEKSVIKLLDFGIAKMIRGNDDEAYLQTITAKGMITGTLNYMSPEQCQSRKLDERTDIYSMGITAYEMVSGRLPFESSSPVQLLLQQIDAQPPAIKNISPRLSGVIFKALSKDPAARYARADEFAAAFAEAVAVEPSSSYVIAGNGAKADAETQQIATQQIGRVGNEAPTLQKNPNNKPGLWGTVRRKFGF